MSKVKSDGKIQKRLLKTSLLLWLISLALPALKSSDMHIGLSAFILGVLFGWTGAALQAYTNFFYLWAFFKSMAGKSPIKSASIAFIGGLTSFWTEGVLTDGANIKIVPIIWWGWGAILWISAYAILFLVVLWRLYPQHKRVFLWGLSIIPIAWIGIFAFGRYQYYHANEEERERLFPSSLLSMAFVAEPLSHIPYLPINITLEKDHLIEIKGEMGGKSSLKLIQGDYAIAAPPKFIYQNQLYVKHGQWVVAKKIDKKPAVDFSLAYYSEGKQIGIRIFDERQQKTAWQAPLITRKGKWNYFTYPDYSFYRFYGPLHNSFYIPDNAVEQFKQCAIKETSIDWGGYYKKYQLSNLDIYYKYYTKPKFVYCNDKYVIFVWGNRFDSIVVLDIESQIFSDDYDYKEKEQKQEQSNLEPSAFFQREKTELRVFFQQGKKYSEIILQDNKGNQLSYVYHFIH